jgi:hypothetical protein
MWVNLNGQLLQFEQANNTLGLVSEKSFNFAGPFINNHAIEKAEWEPPIIEILMSSLYYFIS